MATEQEPAFIGTVEPALIGLQNAAGADIAALYPYDEETDTFYAPLAVGLSDGDVAASLPDLNDQLRRFRADEAQGKISSDLTPGDYGPSAWLLATGRTLVAANAQQEVASSFVRRYHVQHMIGLPLCVGSRTVGLLYLDYTGDSVDVTAQDLLDRVKDAASNLAATVDNARHIGEMTTLRAISQMVRSSSRLPAQGEDGTAANMDGLLAHLLRVSDLDAAVLYVRNGPLYTLVASHNVPALPPDARVLPADSGGALAAHGPLHDALLSHNLHPVATFTAPDRDDRSVLIVADRDRLALDRRLPVEGTLLQTAADLLDGMGETQSLLTSLDDTSRTLSAVTRLSTRLQQPGASEQQTLLSAVDALTDPALPELNFEFADVFLLGPAENGRLMVVESAGATASPGIDSVPRDGGADKRVPVWAGSSKRMLNDRDIVAYVASRRRVVVVAPAGRPDEDRFVVGYPEDEIERLDIPLLRADGTTSGYVHALTFRSVPAPRAQISYSPTDDVTLDADLFHAYGHESLLRVFVPFGSNPDGDHAVGVLEAGYHVSRRQHLDKVQIEALRACAATIAAAVDTARLYERLTERAQQLQIATEVSRAIATSIDLDQTLALVARNMARAVDASICLIALLDEDGSAWYGAASSDMEDVWKQRRVERPERSIVFEVADLGRPVVVEDALNHELVSAYMARLLGIRSLLALPLQTGEGSIGAVLLGQRERQRIFTADEVDRAMALAGQASMAIRNARAYAREEEEHHIQKDVVLVGFGQWGQKAYKHLVLLKNFFNFRTHVVERDFPGRREAIAGQVEEVLSHGDLFYWDSPESPAHDALAEELEPSCYVITYIATPAETHLPLLRTYYDLSNVVLIEKPLGAPPEEYREFLDRTDGSVQIVAADHYWFKIEVRLLELLLTEERNLRAFLDEIEEVEIEILEEQAPSGSGAQIGMIADLIPHAFAILSLLTPLDHLKLAPHQPLRIGRYEPFKSEHETYARLSGAFEHRGRPVRVTIDVGKGVANAKWIKLTGPRRMGGRRPFYKFDFLNGEAMDGTQGALRAAVRPIRQPGVPDNAHLSMLRHVVEKKHPAVGILSIREALRANARIRQLERMAADLIEAGQWTPYHLGQRPPFDEPSLAAEQPDIAVSATP